MKIRYTAILIALTSIFLGACATSGQNTDLAKTRAIIVESDDSPKGKVRNVKLVGDNNKVTVTGLVARDRHQRLLRGHVHVDIYNRYNEFQQSIESDYRFRRMGLKKARTARFYAELDRSIEDEGRIIVTHHDAKSQREPARATPSAPPAASGGFLIIE